MAQSKSCRKNRKPKLREAFRKASQREGKPLGKSAKGVVMPDPTAIEQLVNPDWPFKFQPARTTIQEDLAAVRALPALVIQ